MDVALLAQSEPMWRSIPEQHPLIALTAREEGLYSRVPGLDRAAGRNHISTPHGEGWSAPNSPLE